MHLTIKLEKKIHGAKTTKIERCDSSKITAWNLNIPLSMTKRSREKSISKDTEDSCINEVVCIEYAIQQEENTDFSTTHRRTHATYKNSLNDFRRHTKYYPNSRKLKWNQ